MINMYALNFQLTSSQIFEKTTWLKLLNQEMPLDGWQVRLPTPREQDVVAAFGGAWPIKYKKMCSVTPFSRHPVIFSDNYWIYWSVKSPP